MTIGTANTPLTDADIHFAGEEDEPETLVPGIPAEVVIDDIVKAVRFRFVPEETGTYRFYSVSAPESFGVQGVLYDADMNLISSYYEPGGWSDCEMFCDLNAGTKYYFEVSYGESLPWATGTSYTVSATMNQYCGCLVHLYHGTQALRDGNREYRTAGPLRSDRERSEAMNNKQIGERIKTARQTRGLSQMELGEKLGVSFQAVSSWETGKFIPDAEHLPQLASVLDVSLDALFADAEKDWELKPINYHVGHMFTFVKGRAQLLGFPQTLAVMDLLRAAHGSQVRRSRNGFECSYMAHPLTLACHALAMGLRDDDVLAAALAHDMVEDAHKKPEDLPVNDRVREAVRLVSKNMYDPNEPDWEDRYYENIRKNPLACMVKCLDRVNNLAGMADAFSRKKMIRYTAETDQYYPVLLEVIKKVPAWNDAWWLLRYQMMTMTEAFKRLL